MRLVPKRLPLSLPPTRVSVYMTAPFPCCWQSSLALSCERNLGAYHNSSYADSMQYEYVTHLGSRSLSEQPAPAVQTNVHHTSLHTLHIFSNETWARDIGRPPPPDLRQIRKNGQLSFDCSPFAKILPGFAPIPPKACRKPDGEFSGNFNFCFSHPIPPPRRTT